jgi:hypothetical protein
LRHVAAIDGHGVPGDKRGSIRTEPHHRVPCFEHADQMQCWQAKTQVLMTEMVAFLHWICARFAQPTPLVPVPLLRDTPLMHLGLTWLRRSGVSVPASKPLMDSVRIISRN